MRLLRPVCVFGALLAMTATAVAAEGEWYSDGRIRYDDVNELPGTRPDFDRGRLHATLGYRWLFSDTAELGIALKLSAGTDDNDDNVRNLDNEESDEIELDELYYRYFAGEHTELELGRSSLPLRLSGAVWDYDLRPTGVSFRHDVPLGDFDRLTLSGGYFGGMHIDESDSRLAAVQLEWQWRDGAPRGAGIILSYLDFDDLDGLVADRRTRTNSVANGRLINDYQLLDLQMQMRWPVLNGFVTEIDLIKNLDASNDDEAARLSFIVGNAAIPQQWEFGYTIQRIQRNAVVAAFNEDDWWFPSAMRGYSPWVAYGINDHWRIRLAGFFERRDDRPETLKRYLLDLNWHW